MVVLSAILLQMGGGDVRQVGGCGQTTNQLLCGRDEKVEVIQRLNECWTFVG